MLAIRWYGQSRRQAHDSVNRADLFVALYQNVTRASDAARMLKAYMQQSLFQNAKPDVQRVIAAMDARDELDGANFEFLLTFIQRGKSAEKKKQAFKSLFALMYKLPKSRNLQKTLVNAHILKMEHICDGQDVSSLSPHCYHSARHTHGLLGTVRKPPSPPPRTACAADGMLTSPQLACFGYRS